ncbi:MAG TPA: sugar phosphate nucleotidyltransferase [Acidimicrobiales bacterium]|jgi:glucose-1-phosphate cytidylyltransferase|nr:sugar phosphate nucleotidyltransferase [Acidimicrobiales bacterium]
MADEIPTIILCGGRGTRISEVNPLLPKPLLTIGERPILWHIMKLYSAHGFHDFVLALGWLGEEIRRFFLHYQALTADFRIDLTRPQELDFLGDGPAEPWTVSCIDTGRDSLTSTRVRVAAAHTGDGPVFVTYGDGVGDIDVAALLDHHRRCGRLATVTAVRPPGRFGELILDGDRVVEFAEKPQTSASSISGGFFVFEREAIDRYLTRDDDVMLEREPLNNLVADGELTVYRHDGFWQPMDTPRERDLLNELWLEGRAPWKVWP